MQVLIIPIALALLLYVPGWSLLPRAPSRDSVPGSRLFREVLMSVACTSWIGFVLAEAGVYTLPRLLGLLATLSVAGRWLTGRHVRPYGTADLFGIVVVVATSLWVAPPLDTRILGSDSAGYLASGTHLARHGSLVIHDPTLPLLSPDLKRVLFPSVAWDRGSPPYLRLLGSMTLRSLDSDEVLPAFHHLIAVWVAAFCGLAGSSAAQWVITLFAGLSAWAMAEFGASVRGRGVSVMFVMATLLVSTQYWYSRFLMPEVPGQFFVWAGLGCLGRWTQGRWRLDALLAGVAFGLAGLMRIENAAFLLVALVLGLSFAPTGECRVPAWMLGIAAAIWLHSVVHLTVLRTHYFGNLGAFLGVSIPRMIGSIGPAMAVAAIVALIALMAWRRRATPSDARRFVLMALLGTVICAAVWGDLQHGWSTVRLLNFYVGTPTLIGGMLGLLFVARLLASSAAVERVLLALVVIVFAQVLIAPHATPVPFWEIRRSVTVVLPGLCFGLAVLCAAVARRWPVAAVALFGLALAAQLPPLLMLRREPYFQDALHHARVIGTLIPRGATVLYDGRLVASALPATLWAEYDVPAYLMARDDRARISALVTALGDAPLFWISDGTNPLPDVPGISLVPVAHYGFLFTTPSLDPHTAPDATATWDYSFGVYRIRPLSAENKEGGGSL